MPRNQIVINVDIGETRVALIEKGIITELHVERRGERSVVGDVYLGKVTRVLPGMNAAFVDIGLERAAFLHMDDIVDEGALGGVGSDEIDEEPVDGEETNEETDDEEEESEPEERSEFWESDGEKLEAGRVSRQRKPRNPRLLPLRRPREVRPLRPKREREQRSIRDLVREGQEIVVQVSKGPISTKGARVTSHVSLPGRYVVYIPTVEHVGVSKRIGNEKERRRLREVISQLKPEKGGVIVRTASEGLTKKQLKNDVAYLVQLWGDIWKKRQANRAPCLLTSELDVVLRTVRDMMGPDIDKVVIDDREAHTRCVRFVEQFMPERKEDILPYNGSEPVFDEYGIEDEIGRALARKVPLKSGGYLIIDQAEALTAIDVNSGRYIGKKDVEDTVTLTNLEAVEEIAYQLRLRNLGGLIILDLIDMDRLQNREKVHRALIEALKYDKAKTSILRISELGLIEMTRKRTRESLGRQLYEPCFYCDGTGHTQSKLTIAYEIVRQIRREKDQLAGLTIVVNAHPAVAETLKYEAKEVMEEAQKRYGRKIVVQSKPEYHIEQFDLQGQ